MFRTSGLAALAVALILPLAGCDGNTTANDYGTVSLKLTDANGDEIQEAWVTFTDIYLQGDDGEADPPGTRVYLLEDSDQEFELTSLAGAVADLATGADVPEGDYGQLRVVLGDACIITGAGVFSSSPDYTKCGEPTGTINMTSTGNSGIKVLLHGLHVTGGTQQILLLDFVVNESFLHETGNPNRYNLHAVVHAADISVTGGFDITLADPDALLPSPFTPADFSVTMTPAEGDEETAAFTDDDGDQVFEAHFQYEQPGMDYTLTLNGPAGVTFTTEPAAVQTLTLGSAQAQTVAWVITAAALAP